MSNSLHKYKHMHLTLHNTETSKMLASKWKTNNRKIKSKEKEKQPVLEETWNGRWPTVDAN